MSSAVIITRAKIREHEAGLKAAVKLGDFKEQSRYLNILGELYRHLGGAQNLNIALQLHDREIALCQQYGLKKLEVALRFKSLCLHMIKQYDSAISTGKLCLAEAQRSAVPLEEQRALCNLGTFYSERGVSFYEDENSALLAAQADFDLSQKAFPYFSNALQLAVALNEGGIGCAATIRSIKGSAEAMKLIANAMFNLGRVLVDIGNRDDEAVVVLEKAKGFAAQLNDSELLSKISMALGDALCRSSATIADAEHHLQEDLRLSGIFLAALPQSDPSGQMREANLNMARSYQCLGNFYMDRVGRYADAQKCFKKALKVFRRAGNAEADEENVLANRDKLLLMMTARSKATKILQILRCASKSGIGLFEQAQAFVSQDNKARGSKASSLIRHNAEGFCDAVVLGIGFQVNGVGTNLALAAITSRRLGVSCIMTSIVEASEAVVTAVLTGDETASAPPSYFVSAVEQLGCTLRRRFILLRRLWQLDENFGIFCGGSSWRTDDIIKETPRKTRAGDSENFGPELFTFETSSVAIALVLISCVLRKLETFWRGRIAPVSVSLAKNENGTPTADSPPWNHVRSGLSLSINVRDHGEEESSDSNSVELRGEDDFKWSLYIAAEALKREKKFDDARSIVDQILALLGDKEATEIDRATALDVLGSILDEKAQYLAQKNRAVERKTSSYALLIAELLQLNSDSCSIVSRSTIVSPLEDCRIADVDQFIISVYEEAVLLLRRAVVRYSQLENFGSSNQSIPYARDDTGICANNFPSEELKDLQRRLGVVLNNLIITFNRVGLHSRAHNLLKQDLLPLQHRLGVKCIIGSAKNGDEPAEEMEAMARRKNPRADSHEVKNEKELYISVTTGGLRVDTDQITPHNDRSLSGTGGRKENSAMTDNEIYSAARRSSKRRVINSSSDEDSDRVDAAEMKPQTDLGNSAVGAELTNAYDGMVDFLGWREDLKSKASTAATAGKDETLRTLLAEMERNAQTISSTVPLGKARYFSLIFAECSFAKRVGEHFEDSGFWREALRCYAAHIYFSMQLEGDEEKPKTRGERENWRFAIPRSLRAMARCCGKLSKWKVAHMLLSDSVNEVRGIVSSYENINSSMTDDDKVSSNSSTYLDQGSASYSNRALSELIETHIESGCLYLDQGVKVKVAGEIEIARVVQNAFNEAVEGRNIERAFQECEVRDQEHQQRIEALLSLKNDLFEKARSAFSEALDTIEPMRDEYQGKLNYVIALTYCGEVAHNQGLDFNEPVDVGVRERFMLESLRYLHRAQAEFAILDERLREGDITLDQRHKEKFVFLHAKLLLYLGLLALERSSFEEASSNFQKSADICRSSADLEGEVKALKLLAETFYKVREFDKSADSWARLHRLALANDSKKEHPAESSFGGLNSCLDTKYDGLEKKMRRLAKDERSISDWLYADQQAELDARWNVCAALRSRLWKHYRLSEASVELCASAAEQWLAASRCVWKAHINSSNSSAQGFALQSPLVSVGIDSTERQLYIFEFIRALESAGLSAADEGNYARSKKRFEEALGILKSVYDEKDRKGAFEFASSKIFIERNFKRHILQCRLLIGLGRSLDVLGESSEAKARFYDVINSVSTLASEHCESRDDDPLVTELKQLCKTARYCVRLLDFNGGQSSISSFLREANGSPLPPISSRLAIGSRVVQSTALILSPGRGQEHGKCNWYSSSSAARSLVLAHCRHNLSSSIFRSDQFRSAPRGCLRLTRSGGHMFKKRRIIHHMKSSEPYYNRKPNTAAIEDLPSLPLCINAMHENEASERSLADQQIGSSITGGPKAIFSNESLVPEEDAFVENFLRCRSNVVEKQRADRENKLKALCTEVYYNRSISKDHAFSADGGPGRGLRYGSAFILPKDPGSHLGESSSELPSSYQMGSMLSSPKARTRGGLVNAARAWWNLDVQPPLPLVKHDAKFSAVCVHSESRWDEAGNDASGNSSKYPEPGESGADESRSRIPREGIAPERAKLQLFDTFDRDGMNSFEFRELQNHGGKSLGVNNSVSKLSSAPASVLRVNVRVGDSIYLIPCVDFDDPLNFSSVRLTVDWLTNEAARRVQRQSGRRPILGRVITEAGAVLDGTDDVRVALETGETVTAELLGWVSVSSLELYAKTCARFELPACDVIVRGILDSNTFRFSRISEDKIALKLCDLSHIGVYSSSLYSPVPSELQVCGFLEQFVETDLLMEDSGTNQHSRTIDCVYNHIFLMDLLYEMDLYDFSVNFYSWLNPRSVDVSLLVSLVRHESASNVIATDRSRNMKINVSSGYFSSTRMPLVQNFASKYPFISPNLSLNLGETQPEKIVVLSLCSCGLRDGDIVPLLLTIAPILCNRLSHRKVSPLASAGENGVEGNLVGGVAFPSLSYLNFSDNSLTDVVARLISTILAYGADDFLLDTLSKLPESSHSQSLAFVPLLPKLSVILVGCNQLTWNGGVSLVRAVTSRNFAISYSTCIQTVQFGLDQSKSIFIVQLGMPKLIPASELEFDFDFAPFRDLVSPFRGCRVLNHLFSLENQVMKKKSAFNRLTYLSRCGKSLNTIVSVDLSDCALPGPAAIALAEGFEDWGKTCCHSLNVVDSSAGDNILDMTRNYSLKLNLAHNDFPPAELARLLKAISSILSFQPGDGRIDLDISGLPSSRSNRKVNLEYHISVQSQNGQARAMEEILKDVKLPDALSPQLLSVLRSMCLASCAFVRDCVPALAAALIPPYNPNLDFSPYLLFLDLSYCSLSPKMCESLLQSVASNSILVGLSLRGNCLGLTGAVAVASVVSPYSKSRLREFDLNACELEWKGILVILAAFGVDILGTALDERNVVSVPRCKNSTYQLNLNLGFNKLGTSVQFSRDSGVHLGSLSNLEPFASELPTTARDREDPILAICAALMWARQTRCAGNSTASATCVGRVLGSLCLADDPYLLNADRASLATVWSHTSDIFHDSTVPVVNPELTF